MSILFWTLANIILVAAACVAQGIFEILTCIIITLIILGLFLQKEN